MSKITIELVMIHIANDGAETFEAQFVNEDGRTSSQITVHAGRVKLAIDDDDERVAADIAERTSRLKVVSPGNERKRRRK